MVSESVADFMAHPFAQIGVILVCALWWLVGLPTDILTATLSILAITLTQMVLSNQAEREADAHRRDVAMHAKLDELVLAVRGARDEMAGIEDLDEEDIRELKDEVVQAIDKAGDAAGDPGERQVAKEAVATAVHKEVEQAREEGGPAPKRRPAASLTGGPLRAPEPLAKGGGAATGALKSKDP